jgi:hypothetical protein
MLVSVISLYVNPVSMVNSTDLLLPPVLPLAYWMPYIYGPAIVSLVTK